MKFLDLFAGIGGFRLGLEQSGHECVGFVEWDKFARKSYEAIHDTNGEWTIEDIRSATNDDFRHLRGLGIDIISAGFPCQSFSIAGLRGAFQDTRGTMFFEVARFVKEIRPRFLLLENVKGLLSSKTPLTFDDIMIVLNKEIVGGTIWEETFSPMSNWNLLSDNITHYLSETLQTNLILKNLKSETSFTENSELVYEKLEQEVKDGLMQRLKFLAMEVLQIMKKPNCYLTEQMLQLEGKDEDWALLQERLSLIGSMKVSDMFMLEKMVDINGDVEKMLNKKSDVNLNPMKSSITSTESKQTIDLKICTLLQEQNIILFMLKQWRLSTNLWKKVMLNLTKKKKGMYYVATYNIILSTLNEIGYDATWQVCNSKYFGVPHNRERIFIVAYPRGQSGGEIFPLGRNHGSTPIQIIGSTAPEFRTIGARDFVYSPEGSMGTILATDYKQPKQIIVVGNIYPSGGQSGDIIDPDGISSCLDSMQGGNRMPKIRIKENTKKGYADAEVGDSVNFTNEHSKTRRGRVGKQVANTLETHINQGVVMPNYRIRKLTPRECWRLQAFPDWAFDKAREVNSDSQLYKQSGNSVTVSIVAEIGRALKEIEENEQKDTSCQ